MNIEPYIPFVFRYLERCYVDQFFSDGTLQLNTIFRFRECPDEQRGDKDEGHGTIKYLINSQSVETDIQTDLGSYVMCTSLLHSKELYSNFNYNSCIAIKDPLRFAKLVAFKIKDVENVRLGPCHYVESRILDRSPESNFQCETEHDFKSLFDQTVFSASKNVSFIKNCKFCHQHEYRFLWEVSSAIRPIEQPLLIKVPEAISLCSRLDLD